MSAPGLFETGDGLDLPLRQLTRLRTEMGIAVAQVTGTLFADDPMLGIEFGAVARVCLSDWIRDGSLGRPEVPIRAITIRRMALSLGSAPETVRRHANALLDRGVFVASASGVSLAATEANEALVLHYYLGVHDLFVRLIEDMAATCDFVLPVGSARTFGMADVIERAIEILLLPIDTFRIKSTSRQAFLLWGAMTAVAVREVTYDPVLSRLYADSIPTDDLRVAISVRRLAAMFALPYATVWRRIHALRAQGLVTRLGGDRWTVLTHNLTADSVGDLGTRPSFTVYRKVRELALLGLDPKHAARHYAVGRPALADMGLPRNE